MKKSYAFIVLILSGLVFYSNQGWSQCPGCITNMSCTSSPAAPTICPTVMPDGTAMQPYDQDISFYLPHNFDDQGSGYNVDLTELDVLNVTGLPYGLSFQTNAAPSNIYYPTQNPPTTEHGCGKICGTPIIPGTYTITVFVLAHVTVTSLGYSTTSNSSFNLPITILPGSSANNLFSIDNPLGCTPLNTGFQNLLPGNGHPGYSYAWDFGNGNQSNLENPPAQNYNTPGNYIINLQTTVDTLPYTLTGITVLGVDHGSCSDTWPWPEPDLYFILRLGTTEIFNYYPNYVNDSWPPVTFTFNPIQLTNAVYSLQIMDYDDISNNDDCGTVTFNGYTAGTFTVSNGSLMVSLTIDHPVIHQTATDTVKVFPAPVVSNLTFAPNDSVCENDSVILNISPVTNCTYQWYKDTAAIYNAVNPSYTAKQSGLFYCEIMNTYGCRSYTNNQRVTVIPNPPKPTFWIIGNTLNTNLSGYNLQWYYEGTPIPGSTGMICQVTVTGNYFVIASDFFGCSTGSDTVYATYSDAGIENIQDALAFKLFPNPNKGSFTMELNLAEPKEITVRVTDLLGKTVYEERLGQLVGTVQRNITMNTASRGIYLVTIDAGGIPVHQRMEIN